METSLKWVLALVTAILVVGVIVDFIRHQRRIKQLRIDDDYSDLISDSDDKAVSEKSEPYVSTRPDLPVSIENEASKYSLRSEEESIQTSQPSSAHTSFLAEDMLVVSVMAKPGESFAGESFYETLLDAGFHYGEMKIFHRFENVNGTGQKLFSLVSAIEPGIFNIRNLDELETPGVTLFLTMSKTTNPMSSFELMIRTAKQLAFSLNGELFDLNRDRLTLQSIEQYREKVRQHQRQFHKIAEDEPA